MAPKRIPTTPALIKRRILRAFPATTTMDWICISGTARRLSAEAGKVTPRAQHHVFATIGGRHVQFEITAGEPKVQVTIRGSRTSTFSAPTLDVAADQARALLLEDSAELMQALGLAEVATQLLAEVPTELRTMKAK